MLAESPLSDFGTLNWSTPWGPAKSILFMDERRGAALHAAAKVRQTVYRAREIMARYYTSDRGRRWKLRAAIEGSEYRIAFKPNDLEDDE
jgi:hypothetical protein